MSLKQPLFGDLHVHTSYSHDAYVSLQRNNPWDAYRYAEGESLYQPDANGQFTVQAQERLYFEPVVEITQHKGRSECRFDRLAGRGLGTTDELCTFEQYESDNLQAMRVLYGKLRSEGGGPVSLDELQSEAAPGMPPNKQIEKILDMQHGERGRLVYDCAPKWWLAGLCVGND